MISPRASGGKVGAARVTPEVRRERASPRGAESEGLWHTGVARYDPVHEHRIDTPLAESL
jgi:hypothetical protein